MATTKDVDKDFVNDALSADQVLRVSLQETQFVIDLALVERVISIVALQQLPGAPSYFVGLMDYHGDSIPVVDLGLWLGSDADEPYNLETPIVLCGDGKNRIGFIVDKVLQVETIGANTPQMIRAFKDASSPFLAALSSDTGLSLLLDMKRILTFNFASANASLPTHLQLPKALGAL